MSYFFEFEPVHSFLRCSLSGSITDQHLIECYRTAVQHARRKDPALAILDLTSITSIEVAPGTVQALARSEPTLPGPRPRYIVAPTDHLYGMSRMYQILAERTRPRLQVVRSAAELYAAFGLELRFQAIVES